MKKINYALLLILIIIILVIVVTSFNFGKSKEGNFNINISERLILKSHNTDDLYVYSFLNKEISKYITGSIIEIPKYVFDINKKEFINDNLYINNGKVYLNKKIIFSCNVDVCPFYLDKNKNFLIFIDKPYYKKLFFKKLFPKYTMRILNLKTYDYINLPILNFNGEDLNIQGIFGYIN